MKNKKLIQLLQDYQKNYGKYITFDNFKEGFEILADDEETEHKLRFKHVKGGVLLVDTDFTIK